MQNESCSNCHFYRGFPLTCRVNPPSLVTVMTPEGPGFLVVPPPEVSSGYWCGKWQPEAGPEVRVLQ